MVGDADTSASGEDSSGSDTNPPESTGEGETTIDPDSSTSDTDTPAGGLLELLATVPDGTSWADLDPDVRAAIEQHAADRFAESEAEWGAAALVDKEAAILRS